MQSEKEQQLNLKQKFLIVALLCLLCSLPILWIFQQQASERAKAEATKAARIEQEKVAQAKVRAEDEKAIIKAAQLGPHRKSTMASFIVTGAGSSDYNGTYTENGTAHGYPRYSKDSSHWLVWFDNGFGSFGWGLTFLTSPFDSADCFYVGGTNPDDPTDGLWTPMNGDPPAPTVIEEPLAEAFPGGVVYHDGDDICPGTHLIFGINWFLIGENAQVHLASDEGHDELGEHICPITPIEIEGSHFWAHFGRVIIPDLPYGDYMLHVPQTNPDTEEEGFSEIPFSITGDCEPMDDPPVSENYIYIDENIPAGIGSNVSFTGYIFQLFVGGYLSLLVDIEVDGELIGAPTILGSDAGYFSAPPKPPGVYQVRGLMLDGLYTAPVNLTYEGPVPVSVEPDSGPLIGGTAVTINALNNIWGAFWYGDQVYFGTELADDISLSPPNINCVTPYSMSGLGPVTVRVERATNPSYGELADGFIYTDGEVQGETVKPTFNSATVATDGLSVAVLLNEADSPPILPASSVTGFSLFVNGVLRSISSATASVTTILLNLADAIFDTDDVTLSYSPGNVTDSALTPNAMDAFEAQLVSNNSEVVDDGGGEELPVPDVPDILGYDDNSNEMILPPLPTNAAYLRLWRKRAGDVSFSVFADALAGNARAAVGSLDADIRYDYYATGYNADNESSPSSGIYLLNPGGGGDGGTDPDLTAPAVPAAPTLSKNCGDATVTVTSPVFSVVENAETASIELRRRALPSGEWATVHTFESAGNWIDEDVTGGVGYQYAARACNTSGCSDWSTSASISLISSTLALNWQSPAADAEVLRNVLLRFAAVDAGGAEDLQVFVNGALLSTVPKRVSGTPNNGVYTLPLDTRRAAQGAAVVTIVGVGSDGCKQRAELNLTFANTRALGVLYRDFLTESAPAGQQVSRLPISLGLGEIDSDPSRRYWGQVAVTPDTAVAVVTDATEPEAAQTAFDAMQPFPLVQTKSWPQLGANPPGSVLYGIQSVNTPGPQMKIRVRVEQAEGFLAYDTSSERVAKLRQISAGKHLVLAQNPDRVWLFEDDALTLLADLDSDEGATAVTDVALVGDKVYYLNQQQLIAFDIDPLTGAKQRTMNISPHGETRSPAFIEAVGGKLIALFVDEEMPEAQTLCVALKADQFNDAWTLDAAATLAWSDGANFWIACGGDLYQSIGGVAAPALVKSFTAAITAIGPDAIGLVDGSLWVFKQGEWSNPVLASGAAIVAAGRAYLNFEYRGALWGKAQTATLYGQDAGGGYTVARALGTYDGVTEQPGGVASLDRYFVPAEEVEEGEDAGEAESAAAGDERVLVGTEGGVLLALSVARQSSASAWLHSSITDIEAGGVARLIPVSEEEV